MSPALKHGLVTQRPNQYTVISVIFWVTQGEEETEKKRTISYMSEKNSGTGSCKSYCRKRENNRSWPVHADYKSATDETKITGMSKDIMQIYPEKKANGEETGSSVDNIHLQLEGTLHAVPRVQKLVQSDRS